MATLRKLKNGHWHAQVRITGTPNQSKVFDGHAEAKRWATETEAAIRGNRFVNARAAASHTLHEALLFYVHDVLAERSPSVREKERSRANVLMRYIRGDTPLSQLGVDTVTGFLDKRRQ